MSSEDQTLRTALSVRPSEPSIIAYTDESGNTGNDLFNKDQPWFFTGTLLTTSDIESETAELGRMLAEENLEELHAKRLRLRGIERFSDTLVRIIRQHDCRFMFTKTDKRHYAALKLCDTLLDSGNNDAVPWLWYNAMPLRYGMIMEIVRYVSEDSLKSFWRAYLDSDSTGFSEVLKKLLWHVRQKVKDRRMSNVLDDALAWGIRNPDRLLDCPDRFMASPNATAVFQIIHFMNDMRAERGWRVSRFVHDRHSQFGKSFLAFVSAIQKQRLVPHPVYLAEGVVPSDAFEGEMEVTGDSLVGLQVVDVALWLFARADPSQAGEGCRILMKEIEERSVVREMSRNQLSCDSLMYNSYVMNSTLSEEQLKRGKMLRDEMEEERKARIRQS